MQFKVLPLILYGVLARFPKLGLQILNFALIKILAVSEVLSLVLAVTGHLNDPLLKVFVLPSEVICFPGEIVIPIVCAVQFGPSALVVSQH